MNIDLNKEIHFVVDYRSCPNSIGTIFFDEVQGFQKSLVTDMDCGPKDLEEARNEIDPEFLPHDVIYIPLDNEFYKLREQCLGAILATHRVSYVVDSEMAYEFPELVCDASQNLFTIQSWFEMRNITGVL
jgi:hypothetical protein